MPAATADLLGDFVDGGGHLVTTYFSGIVDEHDHVWPGGYPGALRDLLGIRIEEFGPLLDGDEVVLDDGSTGTRWTDRITATAPDTEVLATYKTGPQAGRPAVTRRPVGRGSATYVSTRLGAGRSRAAGGQAARGRRGATASCPTDSAAGWSSRSAADDEREFWFLVNRTDDVVDLGELGDLGEPVLLSVGRRPPPRRAAGLRGGRVRPTRPWRPMTDTTAPRASSSTRDGTAVRSTGGSSAASSSTWAAASTPASTSRDIPRPTSTASAATSRTWSTSSG